MKRRAEHLRVEPVKDKDRTGYLVFDLSAKCIVQDLTLYSLHMERFQRLDSKTIYKRLIALTHLWEFLRSSAWRVEDLSDAVLCEFRDLELALVCRQPTYRGDVRAAKRTVNEKLGAIFQWIVWMQERDALKLCTVSLPNSRSDHHRRDGEQRRTSRSRGVIRTVVFSDTAAASKHRVGFVPTEKTRDDVQRFFFSQASQPYAAHRNALIVTIADLTGFRRGSLNSLCVAQFERARIEAENEPAILVRPLSQKFGYRNDFAFPVDLALRVCDFIEQYRAPLVRTKGVGLDVTEDRVFLSSRDGRPLTDRSVTQIVSAAMIAAGSPKGSSLHSFRAKYANDQIEEELLTRRENGMDTSTASIAASLAMKLGHRNADSLFAYVSAAQSTSSRRDGAQRRHRISELEEQLSDAKKALDTSLAALAAISKGQ